MKKLTRKKMDELARIMPLINEDVQRTFIGGSDRGTYNNPYSYGEYKGFVSMNSFPGGYVNVNGAVIYYSHGNSFTGSDFNELKDDIINNHYGPTGAIDFVSEVFDDVAKYTGIFTWGDSLREYGNNLTEYSQLYKFFTENPNASLYYIETISRSNLGRERVKRIYYYNGSEIASSIR